jgi:hypothetical protein
MKNVSLVFLMGHCSLDGVEVSIGAIDGVGGFERFICWVGGEITHAWLCGCQTPDY